MKNIEIDDCQNMIECISFMILAEHTKIKLAKSKKYPNFNIKESEQQIQKYRIMANEYQVKLYELKEKDKPKFVPLTQEEIFFPNAAKIKELVESLEQLHNLIMQSDDRKFFDNSINSNIIAKAKELIFKHK